MTELCRAADVYPRASDAVVRPARDESVVVGGFRVTGTGLAGRMDKRLDIALVA